MSVVEEKVPLEYILMGSFEHKTIRREISISNFEDLGYTYYSNWMSLDNRYMVILTEVIEAVAKCATKSLKIELFIMTFF